MPDITQKFIVDAGGSVATLEQLASSFGNLNTNIAETNKTLNGVSTSTNKANKSLNSTSNAAKNLGQQAPAAFNKLTVSFQTFVRIVTTQLIVRALADIRAALNQSVRAAIDFENQVAEISTISAEKNLGNLADIVRDLSDEFNQPLGEVGQGLYQTISSQIADAGEASEFLATALRLARVGATDSESAILLLGGTINAYGESAAEAEAISAKFFETIRLGRTTAGELSGSIGRVQTIAAQVGVSLDELLAAFADTTLAGLNTAESATQIRGALTALIKPTTAMQQALRELGFASGEQAVQALGLQGAFKALIGTTDGSVEAITRLIPRQRGLTFALRVARDENSKFAESLDQIEIATAEKFADQFERVTQTDTQQLTKALNQISNVFTTEFGNTIVEIGNNFIEAAGGVDAITGSLSAAFEAVELLGAALNGVIGIASDFGGLVGSGIINVFDVEGRFSEPLKEERERIKDILSEVEETFKNSQERVNKNLENSGKERLQLVTQAAASINRVFFEEVQRAEELNTQFVNNRKDALSEIVRLSDDFAKDLADAADDEAEAVIDSQQRQLDIRKELQDELFDRRVENLDPIRKAGELQRRANQLASEGARILRDPQATDRDRERALALFDQAKALNDQLNAIAQQTNNAALLANSREQLVRLANQELSAERQLQKISEDRAEAARKAAEEARERAKRVRELAQVVNKASTRFDDEGQLLTDEQRFQNIREANRALTELQNLLAESDDVEIADILQVAGLRDRINRQLDNIQIDSLTLSGEAETELATQIARSFDAVDQRFAEIFGRDQLDLSIEFGFPIENADDFSRAVKQANDRVVELNKQVRQFQRFRGFAETAVNEVTAITEAIEENIQAERERRAQAFTRAGRQTDPEEILTFNRLDRLINQFQLITRDPLNIDEQTVNSLVQASESLRGSFNFDSDAQEFANRLANAAQILKDNLVAIRAAQGLQPGASQAQQEINRLQPILDRVDEQLRSGGGTFSSVVDGVNQALELSASTTTTIANNAISISLAAERAASAAAAAASANQAANSSNPTERVFGGNLAYRQFGGRGLDTTLIAANPGERIVNARSSANFASQIEAINAGQTPVFRNEGGPVTNNITIGDINVQGSGQDVGDRVARDVIGRIRRELRRGTSTLKG